MGVVAPGWMTDETNSSCLPAFVEDILFAIFGPRCCMSVLPWNDQKISYRNLDSVVCASHPRPNYANTYISLYFVSRSLSPSLYPSLSVSPTLSPPPLAVHYYLYLCHRLDIQVKDRLLELDCVRGSFLAQIALAGAGAGAGTRFWGTTCSRPAYKYALRTLPENRVDFAGWREILPMLEPRSMHKILHTSPFLTATIGVKNFPHYAHAIARSLKRNGRFLMQVHVAAASAGTGGGNGGFRVFGVGGGGFGGSSNQGGLWDSETLAWLAFQDRHILPGCADGCLASIHFYMAELENAGLQIFHVENLSRDAQATWEVWHDNWVRNRLIMEEVYGTEKWVPEMMMRRRGRTFMDYHDRLGTACGKCTWRGVPCSFASPSWPASWS